MELENSPLNEVDKNSLAELFAMDPLKLSKEDVEKICVKLREKRKEWALSEAKTKHKAEAKKNLPQIDMDDILNGL